MDPKLVPRKSTLNISEFGNEDIVCRGYLKKKNRWFQQQLRYFQLNKKGDLRYYKDYRPKGKITLAKDTKVLKTAKNQIEIPGPNKTYVLVEVDKKEVGDTT
jgi:hypothetical protein